MSDETRFREDIGAYLLDALDEGEARAFERHLATCEECRQELERLRPAAEVLPGSVEQVEPPPGLKAAIMAEVEREAKAARPTEARAQRPSWLPRLSFPRVAFVAAALLLGLVIGIGVAQLGGGDETRTVAATVDEAMPRAGGTLEVEDGRATLRLHDMPDLGGTQVYQVWLQHGDVMVPARTFEVGAGGVGEVELSKTSNADGVYVTREARGGAKVPSEDPIVSVPL
jgi:anti-sigma factor RsiW